MSADTHRGDGSVHDARCDTDHTGGDCSWPEKRDPVGALFPPSVQTRANTFRCDLCGGGIVMHTDGGGPYGCPNTAADVAENLLLTPEEAARGWDNTR